MKKEIGGYLELEEPAGQEYYPDLCGVNLGRTALLWLMEARKCRKIYLPFFLCDSVTGACERSGAEIEFIIWMKVCIRSLRREHFRKENICTW